MDILIKGMTMPKAGNWKTIRVYYDGTCAEPNWQGDCKIMKGCEAAPIPDHGDLASIEAAKKEIDRFIGYLDEDMILRIKLALSKLPVVIPAERSEDE